MNLHDKISQFCIKPRTIDDVCKKFEMGDNTAHRYLRQLIQEERIIRRTTDQGTERMKIWYLNIEKPPLDIAKLATQSNRLVMGVWM